MNDLASIDAALDDMLVNLAGIMLRLARPELNRTPEARRALMRSVHQFSACAARSADPRVHALQTELEQSVRPTLRVIAGGS